MYNRLICVSANDTIAELSPENGELSAMLGEFAEVCAADGRDAVTVSRTGGRSRFTAGSYCGFVCLADGTLIEILPRTDDGTADARKALCTELCRRCGASFGPSGFDPEVNFMEFLIALFAGETMKIIKSGVLSTYTSREENMNTVHGTILFSENIRRNLVHRERIYVRHDVFTPDRAENRIIKAAAAMLLKLTASSHSSHLLMEALSYLDEVKVPHDVTAEFAKCMNTRNTKKYSVVLNICRMLFDRSEGTSFSGKFVQCAQLYKMDNEQKVRT
ncbi:MAG: hypothetical protein Q4A05_04255 [Ruminococcus sp.]|nr:hypothetical protein [Ruminococcus sp.]